MTGKYLGRTNDLFRHRDIRTFPSQSKTEMPEFHSVRKVYGKLKSKCTF